MNISEALSTAEQRIGPLSDTARLDAEVILCHVLNCNKTYLFTWSDKVINKEDLELFLQLVEKRSQGRPVAHITGKRDFWSLSLNVNESTLIPRPDTETLVETVLTESALLPSYPNLKGLDLGTGTGAIALALASELPNSHWLGLDYSDEAVALAKSNQELNKIDNCQFSQSDWYNYLSKESDQFDIIVSNPPYIDPEDAHLKNGDVRFEPLSALVSEEHGLADIKHIVTNATQYLRPGGLLAIEHGYDQSAAVQKIFTKNRFAKVTTIKDLGQNDRITIGYLDLIG